MYPALICLSLAQQPDPLRPDLCRYPPHQVARGAAMTACRHLEWLREQQRVLDGLLAPNDPRRATLACWVAEAEYCTLWWQSLERATDRGLDAWSREEEVAALRDLAGPRRWFTGWCPPVIPSWHCRSAD
jgi:hypothetical protein